MNRTTEELRAAIAVAWRRQIVQAVLANQAIATELGLSPNEVQFMHLLELHGALTPGRLAALTGLTTGSVTGIIDRLERSGFAQRSRDSPDRRKVLVTLDRGQVDATVSPQYERYRCHLATVLTKFTHDQLQTIAQFLSLLTPEDTGSVA